MEKRFHVLAYIVNLCFFLYFIILIIERVMSVTLTFVNGVNIFSDVFNILTYMTVFLSIILFFVYLITKCRFEIVYIFRPDEEVTFFHLCVASGILLMSGMVHTEYTIPVIQFISYGVLIIGIFLRVLMSSFTSHNKPVLWLSFIYLVCFSMAIPVVYRSNIEYHVAFHILEGITSFLLVVFFTFFLLRTYSGRNNLFIRFPIVIAVSLDAILIAMRWNEEINWFVLIFISLSAIVFTIGYTVHQLQKRRAIIRQEQKNK